MKTIALVASAIFLLDQFTKLLALSQLTPGLPVPVVDGLVSLTLVMNPGLAFGMLAGPSLAGRWLVTLLSLGALCVLGVLSVQLLPRAGRWGALTLGLIFGGAIGNLVDRARFGAVVDFVDIYWRIYHWPAFNVADSAISVGVGLLALRLLIAPKTSTPPL